MIDNDTAGKARLERLRVLAQRAAALSPDAQARTASFAKAAAHAEAFIAKLPERPVYVPPGDRDRTLEAMAISGLPGSLEDALGVVAEHVDGVGHNIGSAEFLAYVPSGGLYESALADYLAAVSNRYAGVGFASPGSARMEQVLIRWLADLIGYPPEANGDLTSGGSIAALSAVIAARENHALKSADVPHAVVYCTTQMHHTFHKALRIAGLGECIVRNVATDESNRMQVAQLAEHVRADRVAGLRPWLIAASAGSTDVGAVDPLGAIADVAEEEALWFHVDAAYGGAFAICAEGRRRLAGIERSDSLILDPHKGFFLPCGLGAVLVRDGKQLYDAYHARGSYMQDMANDTERSPCDWSPELTRPFRALRLWLPLKIYGSEPFAAALEEKLLLAEYFYEQISNTPGIEMGPRPDLSVVTFRLVEASRDAEDLNRRLFETISADGRIYLNTTTINGVYTIRVAILGHITHIESVDKAINVIQETAVELLQTDSNCRS